MKENVTGSVKQRMNVSLSQSLFEGVFGDLLPETDLPRGTCIILDEAKNKGGAH